MKLIHCADLHLDSKMSSNLTKEQARERRNEILRTFVHMVEYAAANEVDKILIAGDMFDTRTVSATTRNVVYDTIVNHPQIDFFYLKGNHDYDSFISKIESIPENLHLFTDEWTTYSYGKVTISGLEIDSENMHTLSDTLVLEHDPYNIVMLHGTINDEINKDALRNKNIDYLALGHIHAMKADKLDERGMYAYPGCLEGRGFDECGEKGFILLEIDEATLRAQYSFVPIASRMFYELPVDVTGSMNTNDIARRIEEEINQHDYPTKSFVKIILEGELDVECEINTDYLAELFEEYFYCLRIKDQTRLLIRFEDYAKDESLKGEFVRTVLASGMDDEEKVQVIRCGILALSGEEF